MRRLAAFIALTSVAACLARPAHAIPQEPTDVLAGCPQLTASGPVAMPQAIGILQVCLDQRYAQRPYTVKVQAGRFSVPLCPSRAGAPHCQAMEEVEGLVITVNGRVLMGDPVLMDLRHSLDKREGKVLAWHAALAEDK